MTAGVEVLLDGAALAVAVDDTTAPPPFRPSRSLVEASGDLSAAADAAVAEKTETAARALPSA